MCSSRRCDEILHFLPVFAAIRIFYPARNINRVRPELADCVRHIFRGQPAGNDKRFMQTHLFQERPFESLPGSAKRSFPMTIDQKAENGIIVNSLQELDVFQPKSFEYRLMVSSQRFTEFPRLLAMKLQSVENVHLQQLQCFTQCRIDDDRDSRDLGRQRANPSLLPCPLNKSCRSRVQIESQSVRSAFDSGFPIKLTFYPKKLDEHPVQAFAEETLRVERVSCHGSLICCGNFHHSNKNPSFFRFTGSGFELRCATLELVN